MEILCSFRLVLDGKTGKEIPDSSRLEFLKTFSANDFALSDTEDNTSSPLNRGDKANLLSARTLLAIHQNSKQPSFWEVMDSFVLVAYASLADWRTLLQRLRACLNFTLDSEVLFRWYMQKKKKKDFYELWQQHKLLKTMEMSEVWLDTYDEGYISIPTWTHSLKSLAAVEALSLKISSYRTCLKWSRRPSLLSTRIATSYAVKWDILFWVYWWVNWNCHYMIKISQQRETHFRRNTCVRRNKSKRAGLWESEPGIRVGKLTIWVRS